MRNLPYSSGAFLRLITSINHTYLHPDGTHEEIMKRYVLELESCYKFIDDQIYTY